MRRGRPTDWRLRVRRMRNLEFAQGPLRPSASGGGQTERVSVRQAHMQQESKQQNDSDAIWQPHLASRRANGVDASEESAGRRQAAPASKTRQFRQHDGQFQQTGQNCYEYAEQDQRRTALAETQSCGRFTWQRLLLLLARNRHASNRYGHEYLTFQFPYPTGQLQLAIYLNSGLLTIHGIINHFPCFILLVLTVSLFLNS